jgi:hypothetical protein
MTEEEYNPCVDVFLKMIKEADPDFSKQMKSHYKKQFIKMSEDPNKQNLVYKLCLKMWEMEDQIRYLDEKVEVLSGANRELKAEIKKI